MQIKQLSKSILREMRRRLLTVKGTARQTPAVPPQSEPSKQPGRFPSHAGYCTICGADTIFVKEHEWLRDHYKCAKCQSIPRFRALIRVLDMIFPNWRDLTIHESSPGSPSSEKLERECLCYSKSQFFPDVPSGQEKWGFRSENLERLTFPSESFDLVVTQDVFEHVLDPARAFAEIARVLKPGGAHVFTVPHYVWQKTLVRAGPGPEGVVYHAEKEYHGNPIDPQGSLVVTEWGYDLTEFIYKHSGLINATLTLIDPHLGLEAKFLEVQVSRKQPS